MIFQVFWCVCASFSGLLKVTSFCVFQCVPYFLSVKTNWWNLNQSYPNAGKYCTAWVKVMLSTWYFLMIYSTGGLNLLLITSLLNNRLFYSIFVMEEYFLIYFRFFLQKCTANFNSANLIWALSVEVSIISVGCGIFNMMKKAFAPTWPIMI